MRCSLCRKSNVCMCDYPHPSPYLLRALLSEKGILRRTLSPFRAEWLDPHSLLSLACRSPPENTATALAHLQRRPWIRKLSSKQLWERSCAKLQFAQQQSTDSDCLLHRPVELDANEWRQEMKDLSSSLKREIEEFISQIAFLRRFHSDNSYRVVTSFTQAFGQRHFVTMVMGPAGMIVCRASDPYFEWCVEHSQSSL
eukprot:Gregarina_sp_Poly_1__4334@NODE_234_length_11010_cov_523_298456_g207_i0_p6_GENE_NODE_234_length_11010_cov_523_298456_g207_i0NODE_234_length_11010_cov_523_298456_g207_i0_p6_ORF_typecomplete_len198_score14_99T6PP_N/PF18572_1/0_09_NODE_234_length_11010_cov_523_298456_g207_i0138731